MAGCARGLFRLAAGAAGPANIVAARFAVADGIVTALGFKTAASPIELRSWNGILMLLAVFALLTLVKRAVAREEVQLRTGTEARAVISASAAARP